MCRRASSAMSATRIVSKWPAYLPLLENGSSSPTSRLTSPETASWTATAKMAANVKPVSPKRLPPASSARAA
eukprot:scaffold8736_cov114-Isochrysis_galbana.AAC.3